MVTQIFTALVLTVLLLFHSSHCLVPDKELLENARQPKIQPQQFKNFYNSLSEILNRKNWLDLVTDPQALVRPSKECIDSFGRFFGHIPSRPADIFYLIDSFAKPEPGILTGNSRWVGNWDECLVLNNTRYITLTVPSPLGTGTLSFDICLPVECENKTNIIGLLDDLLIGELVNTSKISNFSHVPLEITPGRILTILLFLIFGILIVLSTAADMTERAVVTLNRIFRNGFHEKTASDIPSYVYAGDLTDRKTSVNVADQDFTSRNSAPDEYSKLLMSETYSIGGKQRVTNVIRMVYEPFSLYTNVKKVFNTEQPPGAIRCLNGIRAISMFWVILGHIYLMALGSVNNVLYVFTDVAPRFSFQPILNGYFSVDSFFVLSGFLVMYLSLRELGRTKRHGRAYALFLVKFYVHRILRITPTLFIILVFYWQITPILSDGPMWRPSMDLMGSGCDNFLWVYPILYINNFYPSFSNTGCMSWTWYLANDMQFFIFSPVFIFPAFFLRFQYALIPLAIAIVLFLFPSFIVAGVLALHSNFYFPMNHLIDGLLPIAQNMTKGDLINSYYIKPYCRINPYLIGLALGYIIWKISLWKVESGKRRMLEIVSTVSSIIMWPVSFILCIALVYGLYGSFHGHLMTEFENILYIGTSRTLWGLGLAMFIFICYSGMGGPVDSFLSWGVFVPLSRLTFTAYLIHPVVVEVFYASLRDTLSYYDITFAFLIIGLVSMSYAAAAIFAVCIEFPLANVEDLILRRKKRENQRK